MKKLVSMLSVLGLLISAVPALPANAGEATIVAGDADNSGSVDILDVITVNKAILGKETLTEQQVKAIDFNGNGKPDSDEALELMKFIIGITKALPAPVQEEKQIVLPKGYVLALAKETPLEAENICSDFETQTIVAIDDYSDVRGYVLPVRDENAPETLETKYAPAWLPEGCSVDKEYFTYRFDENLDLTDFAYTFSQAYTNSKNGTFYFHQTLEEDFHFCYSLTDNAEDTSNFTHKVYPVTIGEKEGFCYEYTFTSRAVKTPLTSYEIFWKQDSYIMSIEAYGISLEEAIQMAESVTADASIQKQNKSFIPDGFVLAKSASEAETDGIDGFNIQIVTPVDGQDCLYEYITADIDEDAPETLETYYSPTWIPKGSVYEYDYFTYASNSSRRTDKPDIYSRSYITADEKDLSFHQYLEGAFNTFFETPETTSSPFLITRKPLTVNGSAGYYLEISEKGVTSGYSLYWKQDGYVMNIESYGISLEEATQMAESITADASIQKQNKSFIPDGFVMAKSVSEDKIDGFSIRTITPENGQDCLYEYITANIEEDAPLTLETHYTPTWIPEGSIYQKDYFTYVYSENKNAGEPDIYSKGYRTANEKNLTFHQYMEDAFCTFFETPETTSSPFVLTRKPLTVNGSAGYYLEISEKGVVKGYSLYWKQDGYVMSIESYGISLEEAIQMAESVTAETSVQEQEQEKVNIPNGYVLAGGTDAETENADSDFDAQTITSVDTAEQN